MTQAASIQNPEPGAPRIEDVVREAQLAPEEEKQLETPDYEDAQEAATMQPDGAPPAWFNMPPDVQLPKGKNVTFLRFRAKHTDYPAKGERQCAMWNLTEADEKLADKRCRGDGLRVVDERTKQMIRIVDGKKADWTMPRGPGSVQGLFDEVGGGYRQQLRTIYVRTHSLSAEAAADFFTDCIAVRAIPG